MSNIISFYGTDGSGKSTIAGEFSSLHPKADSIVIGGSSYKDWLTPEVAKLTLGENHTLGDTSGEIEDKVRLYEDIAIACYGLAHVLVNRGSEVVIDSDPIFKRVIWGTLGLSDKEANKYVKQFEDRAQDILGESSGADIIVGVNVGDSQTSAVDTFARISERDSNTEHDPTDIESLVALDNHVNHIWRELNLGITGLSNIPIFNRTLANSMVYTVQNPQCPPEEIQVQARSVSVELRSKIDS